MSKENISKEILNAIKIIATEKPESIFCGSLGLVLNGLLDRKVGDIDIITDRYYPQGHGFIDLHLTNKGVHSQHFANNNNNVLCFKLNIEGVKVDCMHIIDHSTSFEEIDIDGITIRVENPQSAIEAKKGYIVSDNNEISRLKHLRDLIDMNVDKNIIVDLINDVINNQTQYDDFLFDLDDDDLLF